MEVDLDRHPRPLQPRTLQLSLSVLPPRPLLLNRQLPPLHLRLSSLVRIHPPLLPVSDLPHLLLPLDLDQGSGASVMLPQLQLLNLPLQPRRSLSAPLHPLSQLSAELVQTVSVLLPPLHLRPHREAPLAGLARVSASVSHQPLHKQHLRPSNSAQPILPHLQLPLQLLPGQVHSPSVPHLPVVSRSSLAVRRLLHRRLREARLSSLERRRPVANHQGSVVLNQQLWVVEMEDSVWVWRATRKRQEVQVGGRSSRCVGPSGRSWVAASGS